MGCQDATVTPVSCLPASPSVAARRLFSATLARVDAELLPRPRRKQELDAQKPPSPLSRRAVHHFFPLFFPPSPSCTPVHRRFHRHRSPAARFTSPIASPFSCAPARLACAVPLRWSRPCATVFLGDVRSAAVGIPLWCLSSSTIQHFGFALMSRSWSAHTFHLYRPGHAKTRLRHEFTPPPSSPPPVI